MTPPNSAPIIFFGTGPVSRLCLDGIGSHFEIEAVITKPDRISPHGRPHPTPVKDWAVIHHRPIYQPRNQAELAALISPGRFTSPVGLVVDYGLIIPQSVIQAFAFGIINSHFSLLPQWRGADPITFAILSGQATTGVSLMQIVPQLDEGDLLAQAEYSIPPDATAHQLTTALSDLSNQLLIKHLPTYIAGRLKPYPQSTEAPTYSRKLTKADGLIDLSKPAAQLEREIRAFLGWPGSRTQLAGTDVTITAAHAAAAAAPDELALQTADGYLIIERLIPAGRRDMSGRDFLRGRRESS